MSWNGIKKAINRAGTQVMVKTGHVDETVDKQYEFEEKRFKLMEKTAKKLHSDLRQYLESLRILSTAQVNLSEVMSAFYGEQHVVLQKEDEPSGSFSEEYNKVMKHLNEETLKSLESPYNQVVLNPVARFNSYFVEVNEAIKKRNNKKLDYDLMRSRLNKLIDKPKSDNADEYEAKLEASRQDVEHAQQAYDELNDNLKVELPKLINLRVPFLNPSFESFVKLQLGYFSEASLQLDELHQKLDSGVREDYINGTLQHRLDDVLGKMKELNITGSR